MTWRNVKERTEKKVAWTYDQFIECYPCAPMRLKVDESLNVGYTKETVLWDTLGQEEALSVECIVRK